jgi:methylmalonyl-CoA mutase N-terminal domain/subunit
MQREIAENSYRLSRRVEDGKDRIVGVNKYETDEKKPIDTLKIDFKAQRAQVKRLQRVRRERNQSKVKAALARVEKAFEKEDENSIYPMLQAVLAYATLGEVVDVGRKVFGQWTEPMIV